MKCYYMIGEGTKEGVSNDLHLIGKELLSTSSNTFSLRTTTSPFPF